VTRDTLRIADNPSKSRYEARIDDRLAGFVTYRLDGDAITFVHTEIERDYRGEGIGGELARAALDDARARGLAVYPFCPYMTEWIQQHREYVDLVPVDSRAQFDLA
jgi:uncharacterized protein